MNPAPPPYPWQARAWAQLAGARRQGRLGHAWLVTGRPGSGKQAFVRALSGAVLCEEAGEAACGHCRSCLLLAAGNHPDLGSVSPAEGKAVTGIEQIRELNEYFTLSAHYGRAKLAVIDPAEAMNRAAANALLKLLEEPPSLGLLVLVSARPDLLLPTLRSRCQHLALDRYTDPEILDWLAANLPTASPAVLQALYRLGGRSPLGALAAESRDLPRLLQRVASQMAGVARGRIHAVQAAASLEEIPVSLLSDLMQRLVHGLLSQELEDLLGGAGEDLIAVRDGLNSSDLGRFVADAQEVKRLASAAANLKPLDLSETLWLAWMTWTRARRRRA